MEIYALIGIELIVEYVPVRPWVWQPGNRTYYFRSRNARATFRWLLQTPCPRSTPLPWPRREAQAVSAPEARTGRARTAGNSECPDSQPSRDRISPRSTSAPSGGIPPATVTSSEPAAEPILCRSKLAWIGWVRIRRSWRNSQPWRPPVRFSGALWKKLEWTERGRDWRFGMEESEGLWNAIIRNVMRGFWETEEDEEEEKRKENEEEEEEQWETHWTRLNFVFMVIFLFILILILIIINLIWVN